MNPARQSRNRYGVRGLVRAFGRRLVAVAGGNTSTSSGPLNAALLWRQVAKAGKAETGLRTPNRRQRCVNLHHCSTNLCGLGLSFSFVSFGLFVVELRFRFLVILPPFRCGLPLFPMRNESSSYFGWDRTASRTRFTHGASAANPCWEQSRNASSDFGIASCRRPRFSPRIKA